MKSKIVQKKPKTYSIEYEAVAYIERNSPTVSAMAALLGWPDDQVDQMWQKALAG